MSHRKAKPKNKPSLSNPISQPSSTLPFHFTSFHPFKPLFAATTTAIGQNVICIYDTDQPIQGAQDVRTEIRLKGKDEVTCLRWAGYEGKKRKRANTGGELAVGVNTGRIYIIEHGSGEITRTLEGHTAPVRAWAADEDFRGWSCGGDGKLKCWDIRTGSCLTTVTPKVDGLNFTALAVSADNFFLPSSQTLFLLSNPSGEVLGHTTAQTTDIHTVIHLPEKNIIATAAVGERFINVFTNESHTFRRIGSLTCTLDVRTFLIQEDTLLAITIDGTLEIFRDFSVGFEPTKKGGMTKSSNAKVHLTTSHNSKIEIQDAVSHGQDTLISWIEGAKTGFEVVNLQNMIGESEITVQSRRVQSSSTPTIKPYSEANVLVFNGTDPPQTHINGTKPDISFADRLSQLHSTTVPVIPPNASSLSTVLTQALNLSDVKLLQSCFNQHHDHDTIHNTLTRLSPSLVPSLLSYFNSVLSGKSKRVGDIVDWVRETVVVHGGYLVAQSDSVREVLLLLKGTLDRQGQNWERLVQLKGQLEILRTIKGRERRIGGREPEVRWGEDDDESVGEVEDQDVRYLTADRDMVDEVLEDAGDEVVGDDDEGVERMNDVGSEDEDEEEEEEAATVKKVNGVSHFSNSEDSAVDLNDLINDEASEVSENEDDDDESEDISPPNKKPKSRR